MGYGAYGAFKNEEPSGAWSGAQAHTLTAHCRRGSDPGVGMQSVALKLERHYFSIVNKLID